MNRISMIKATTYGGSECIINPYEIQAVQRVRGYTYDRTEVVLRGGARLAVQESLEYINSAWADCLLIDRRGGAA